jgi:hypothetical protein
MTFAKVLVIGVSNYREGRALPSLDGVAVTHFSAVTEAT